MYNVITSSTSSQSVGMWSLLLEKHLKFATSGQVMKQATRGL